LALFLLGLEADVDSFPLPGIDWVAHFPDQKINASWPFAAYRAATATLNHFLGRKFPRNLTDSVSRMGKVRNSVRYGTPVFYLRNQRNLA
jgi:hypothetical protein